MARSVPKPLSKRMVFENDHVEALCISYKRDRDFGTYYEICRYTKNLMDSIILGSKFNRHVSFHDLCSHLFLQVERWIDRWIPGQGTIYSYFSICIKHGCCSFVSREATLRQRQVLTGDIPLETVGASYVMDFSGEGDLVDRIRREVHVRWHDPDIQDAVRYVVEEILMNGGIRQRKILLRTMEYAFDLGIHTEASLGRQEPVEVAKFLVDWTSMAVRQIWLDHRTAPITSFDIIRLQSRFSFLPDLVNCIGLENTSKVMSVFSGVSLRLPTIAAWDKTKQLANAYEAYLKDPVPATIRHWAKRLRIPEDKFQEIMVSWAGNSEAGVLEDATLDAVLN